MGVPYWSRENGMLSWASFSDWMKLEPALVMCRSSSEDKNMSSVIVLPDEKIKPKQLGFLKYRPDFIPD
jgi:hypothetical protein